MGAGRTGVGRTTAAGALGCGAAAWGCAAGSAGAFLPPVKRSITDFTASRVLRSFRESSSGAEAGERRISESESGKKHLRYFGFMVSNKKGRMSDIR